MKRLKVLFFIICFLSFCSFGFAQDKPVAVKIAEYDEKTETIETFVERTKVLLKKLSESPKTTTGLIAIPTEDFPPYTTLFEQAENILYKNTALVGRVEISKPVPPGYRPKSLPEKTEFWLIPLNAEKPYSFELICALTICPTIEIDGYDLVYDKNKRQTFSANITGGGQVSATYNWTLSAGKITSGNGSPVIDVDLSKVEREEIVVEVEIGGVGEFCTKKAERKIKIVKQK